MLCAISSRPVAVSLTRGGDHAQRVNDRGDDRRLAGLLGDRPALLAPALGAVVVGEHPGHRAEVVELLG